MPMLTCLMPSVFHHKNQSLTYKKDSKPPKMPLVKPLKFRYFNTRSLDQIGSQFSSFGLIPASCCKRRRPPTRWPVTRSASRCRTAPGSPSTRSCPSAWLSVTASSSTRRITRWLTTLMIWKDQLRGPTSFFEISLIVLIKHSYFCCMLLPSTGATVLLYLSKGLVADTLLRRWTEGAAA